MGVSLKKGEGISLRKDDQLDEVMLGLGWDAARGWFGLAPRIDLDASCMMLGRDGRIRDAVWFRHLRSKDGSVRHSGDNLTGAGDGDDEMIRVRLSEVPADVEALVFTVTSYWGQRFARVQNAFCRLVDVRTGREIARYDLACQGDHTALIMARLERCPSGWRLVAIGEACQGRTYKDLARA
ncbi:MAG: stress protein [Cyanobacteria bacterium RYN_339]|nr:stress protein [Cyanobacteria bacterium RYN_339]